jgi:hypothetical protein
MISIFKLDGEEFKAIFAINFNKTPYLFFYFNQKWVGETDPEVKALKEEYFKSMNFEDLKNLDLGESFDFNKDNIVCLSKFTNPKSGVKEVLYSYSELLLVDD